MRRLPRILLNATTVIFLLLWISSYWWHGEIYGVLRSHDGWLTFYVGGGHAFLPIPVPYWLIVVPLLIVHTRILRTFLVERRRRPLPGHCPDCGYDLRATPARCPECGAVPPPPPPA